MAHATRTKMARRLNSIRNPQVSHPDGFGLGGADSGGAIAVAAIKQSQLATFLDDVGISGHPTLPSCSRWGQGQIVSGSASPPSEPVVAFRLADGVGSEPGSN